MTLAVKICSYATFLGFTLGLEQVFLTAGNRLRGVRDLPVGHPGDFPRDLTSSAGVPKVSKSELKPLATRPGVG